MDRINRQILQYYSQSFDAAGNITQLIENGTLTTAYGYDQLNRLTSENIGDNVKFLSHIF